MGSLIHTFSSVTNVCRCSEFKDAKRACVKWSWPGATSQPPCNGIAVQVERDVEGGGLIAAMQETSSRV